MPLTKEEQEALEKGLEEKLGKTIGEQIDAKVNGAVKSHLSRELPKAIEGATPKLLEGLKDGLKDLIKPPDPSPDDKDKGRGKTKNDDGDVPPAVQKRLDDLQRSLEAEKKRGDAAEAKSKEETDARRRKDENDAFAGVLRKKGVSEVKVQAALAYLRENGRIARGSDDGILFKNAQDKYKNTVDMNAEAGLEWWIGTDEGKEFMPASGARGSGAQHQQQRQDHGDGNRKVTDADVGNALFGAFAGAPMQVGGGGGSK